MLGRGPAARLAPIIVALVAGCAPGQAQPLSADQIPAVFIAATSAADRTMHVEWSGTYSVGALGAATVPFTASLDFAGADYAGTVSGSGTAPDVKAGLSNQTEIALVGGQGYQRTPYSNGWQRMSPAPSLDPFGGLAVDDVEYVAQEMREGATVHHLRIRNFSPLAGSIFGGLNGGGIGPVRFSAEHSSFDVYVDSAAHPVSATLNLGTDAQPSDFGAILVTSTYTFSNWGAQFYIVAPPNVP